MAEVTLIDFRISTDQLSRLLLRWDPSFQIKIQGWGQLVIEKAKKHSTLQYPRSNISVTSAILINHVRPPLVWHHQEPQR